MKTQNSNIINNNLFNSEVNIKIKGRNLKLINSPSARILNINNNIKSGILNENKRIIHIKKLSFKRLPKPATIDNKNVKIFHAKIIDGPIDYFKKINELFSSRLLKKRSERESNYKECQSNNSNKLPKLFPFNENINIYPPKSNSVSYKNNRFNIKYQFNPNFPSIKNIQNEDNKIRNIQININNFQSLLKNKKLINNVENSNSFGYKSIYLSLDCEKKKIPKFMENYINKVKLNNNSRNIICNKKKNDFLFKKPKKRKDMNLNVLKYLYRNQSDLNLNIIDIQNNEEKTNIQNDQNLDTDLMLNDKGTLINFNDVMDK